MERVHAWIGVAAGVGIGLALACGEGGAFECSSDAQCVQPSGNGTCEPTGYCSFPDPDCPSGRRYGSLAGGGLAHTCVDPIDTDGGTGDTETLGPPTTSISTAAATSDPSADTSLTSPGTESSSGPDPPDAVCGNGRTEPGEACDDGNDEPGDGCNPDCVASGTALCTDVPDAGVARHGYALGVSMIGDELVVAGWEQTEAEGDNVALRRYDLDCGIVWAESFDAGMHERAFDVAADPVDETIWVAGSQRDAADVERRYVVRFDGAGEFLDSDVRTPGGADAIELEPGGGAVVGGHEGDGPAAFVMWTAHYDPSGVLSGELLSASGEIDRARDVAVAADLGVFLAGNRGTNTSNAADFVVDAVEGTSMVELVRVPPNVGVAEAQAIAIGSGDDLFVGGYLQTKAVVRQGSGPRDAYVARYTPAGDLVWADTYGTAATEFSDEVEAIAIAPNDDVVVAGFLNAGTAASTVIWVRRYTADGQMRWEATFDHAGFSDIGRGIAIAPGGELVVVGEVGGDDGFKDPWVAVLAP